MFYWWNCEEMREQGYDDCKAKYGTEALEERFYPEAFDPRAETFYGEAVGLERDDILARFKQKDDEGKALIVLLAGGEIVGVFNIILQCPPFCP